MASISSLTGSSSASSIYGNRNVISGLASGMDTESMIENAVSGIKKKIQGLQQKQTKVQWKQDAYRSILDKMIALNRKYTSYTSSTNLFSASFFNKAVKTTTAGKFSDAVTATGRTNSDVRINSIKQLATAASYKTDVASNDIFSKLGLTADASGKITAGEELNLTEDVEVGALSGSMTLTYGDNSVYLSFGEKDVYHSTEELAQGIRDKLSEAMVRTGSGDYVKASDRIDVKVDGDKITFADKTTGGNAVYVSSIDKALQRKLNMDDAGEDTNSFKISNPDSLIDKKDPAAYLSDKTLNVTFNGKSKTIDLGDLKTAVDKAWDEKLTKWEADNPGQTITDDQKKTLRGEALRETLQDTIQKGLDKEFGAGKITANLTATADGSAARLSFQTHSSGDTLSVTSSASKVLGMGEDGVSSYLNTNTKLKNVFKDKFHDMTEDEFKEYAKNNPEDVKRRGLTLKKMEEDGKEVVKVVDKDGVVQRNKLSIEINGQKMSFDEDTTIDSMMSQINSNKDAGVNISYSKLTNQFSIKGTETGENSKIAMSGDLARIFGFTEDGKVKFGKDEYDLNDEKHVKHLQGKGVYSAGQDAEFNVTINGQNMDMKRASNSVDFDGMTVTLNKTFDGRVDADGNTTTDSTKWDPITFKTESDSDKIVDAIQSFVNDYNAMVTEIRNQYSTMPAEKSSSSHTRYEPLTDADRESMSESAIEAYEEKAKQGILFGETELSSLHSALRNAITGISMDMNASSAESAEFSRMLQKIGLSTKYSSGLTTLELDTEKLRKTIEEDPDAVRDAFVQTKENGASTDGLMQRIQKVVNQYANTSSGSPGILVQRAGSQYAPTSVNNNALQDQYNRYAEQIEKLQSKMADRIDYYTRQFTALEQMMVQMNSQSSAMAGLMGGSGGSY